MAIILTQVIKDATQGSESGKTISLYVLDALICIDYEKFFLSQLQSRGFLRLCFMSISNLSYQTRSEARKANRKWLKHNHTSGSRSIVSTMTSENAPTDSDGELDFPEVYRKTHQHKNKEWIDPFCAEKYSQMVTLRKESNETGRKVTPEDFSREVLGGNSTYLRGFGSGLRLPKPTAPGAMFEVRDKEVEKLKAASEEQSKEREREREEQRKEREIECEERRKEREEHQKQMADQ